MEDSTIEKAIIYRAICSHLDNLRTVYNHEKLTPDSIYTEQEFITSKVDMRLEISATKELKSKYSRYKNHKLWHDTNEHIACADLIENLPAVKDSLQEEIKRVEERLIKKPA